MPILKSLCSQLEVHKHLISLSKLGKVGIKKCSKTFVKELQSEFQRGRRERDGVTDRKPGLICFWEETSTGKVDSAVILTRI